MLPNTTHETVAKHLENLVHSCGASDNIHETLIVVKRSFCRIELSVQGGNYARIQSDTQAQQRHFLLLSIRLPVKHTVFFFCYRMYARAVKPS